MSVEILEQQSKQYLDQARTLVGPVVHMFGEVDGVTRRVAVNFLLDAMTVAAGLIEPINAESARSLLQEIATEWDNQKYWNLIGGHPAYGPLVEEIKNLPREKQLAMLNTNFDGKFDILNSNLPDDKK